MTDIHVLSRKCSQNTFAKLGNVQVLDLTSKGPSPWVKFSPFFPHGGIPVPFSPGVTSASVEGIWQGLKVFAATGVDARCFENRTMRNLKRTVRKHGSVLGHREGVAGERLLTYREARYAIYLPVYRWVLENRLGDELKELAHLRQQGPLVLLDYETNCSVDDVRKPLSHASLVKAYLMNTWPEM